MYLARTVFTYDVQTPLGTEDALWPVDELRANHHILFASNPFLKSLLDCAASKSADAKNLNLLLKSLTVDSSDSGRGVHVAQIAAALGMSAAATRQAKKKNVLSIPPARVFFDSRQVHGMSFNPTTTEGLTELAGVIEQELGLNQKLRSTADFVARVRLRNDAEPFRFLRALRLLGSESLNDSREGRVRLVDWKVRFSSTPFKSILIELTCHNHFSTAAKQALWEHHQHGRDEIHNLRRHFGELCRCVGAFPLFMTAHDAAKYPEPGPSSLFVIVETYDAVLLRNISTFRILLVEPPIQS